MYIVQLLDEVVCRYLLSQFGLLCHLIWMCLCWFIFWLDYLSICDSGKFNSPTNIVGGSMCAFKSSSICLIEFGALTFGTYVLKIVISALFLV
jgi:hypothetical protein